MRTRGNHATEFVFVDCCSTDGSLNYFRSLARREAVQLIVTHPEEPFVYARNCNRGAQVARGRYLIFANNDIEAKDPYLFDKLARCLNDQRVGVVGTRTDHDCTNELQEASTLSAEHVWSLKPVQGFFWGSRAEVFAELGGLDERYRDYGCDEVDFEYRAIRMNYRLAVVDSLIHHELHATFGRDIREPLMRNMERFAAKHGCRLYRYPRSLLR
jgi:GT2 family glycosyltransferase